MQRSRLTSPELTPQRAHKNPNSKVICTRRQSFEQERVVAEAAQLEALEARKAGVAFVRPQNLGMKIPLAAG